jgi:hypothetical protein
VLQYPDEYSSETELQHRNTNLEHIPTLFRGKFLF